VGHLVVAPSARKALFEQACGYAIDRDIMAMYQFIRAAFEPQNGPRAAWCRLEHHGAMSGVMKAQIDWIPLSVGADARQNACGDIGFRRVSILQRSEPKFASLAAGCA
jgi:hypothetical protein